jgi:hypothetical protein
MTYTLDTSHRAKAFTKGRHGFVPEYIIVHWWGDPAGNPQFDGIVDYFVRGGNTTSAHYVAEAGRVASMVDNGDTAYHAGNWGMNLRSIGIECNPRASDADKATVAELIKDLQAVHGNLPIIGHRDVVSTDCPGAYYPPNRILAQWLNDTPPIESTVEDEDMKTFVIVPTDPDPTHKGWVYLTDGVTARHVKDEQILADLATLATEGLLKITQPPSSADTITVNGVVVRTVRSLDVVGTIVG